MCAAQNLHSRTLGWLSGGKYKELEVGCHRRGHREKRDRIYSHLENPILPHSMRRSPPTSSELP